jgi:tetratricopeptide (TPR) repeat protein
VVIDTETTGLVPDHDRVVWIAAAVIDDRAGTPTVTSRWSVLLDPGQGSRVRVGTVELAGQPTFDQIEPQLTSLLEDGVLVAHNASFDVAFLAAEYKRAGRRMPNVPVLCTLRLTKVLGLDVASYSLVDCCAGFGLVHQRRHRADEDVEATVQLLDRLLPAAAARGWATTEAVLEALAPVGGDRDAGLVVSISVRVEDIHAELLVKEVGWQPGAEPAADALDRFIAQRRAKRAAWLGTMTPAHRAAHEALDALDAGERRAQTWLPLLERLDGVGCPPLELAEAWMEYGRQLDGRRRDARRAVDAYSHALDAGLAAPGVTRRDVNHAVLGIESVCHGADLPEVLIEAYQRFGSRLAALPPCGSCGDLTIGCRAGRACHEADLAVPASWAPFDVAFDADMNLLAEDPAQVERRARAVLPLLAAERTLDSYAQAASTFAQRLTEWGRADEALAVWAEATAHCASRDVPGLPEQADRFAAALAHAKRFADACAVAEPAVAWARQQADPAQLWKLGDDYGFWLERAGRLNEAVTLWRELVDAGSDVLRTFDRLSLALDRAGDPAAAAQVVQTGLGRFNRHVRASTSVQRLEQRGIRCQAKATGPPG